MEKELDPNIIKATQTSLGKYVKRPPLSEKLLKKPPFRFLHDIVTAVEISNKKYYNEDLAKAFKRYKKSRTISSKVLKTTGFFEGLFDPEELISDNVKDRESKIIFLNKVISVIGLTTGKQILIKPSKVVAGQEADKTNELLQTLALALDQKLSSEEAVKKLRETGNVQQVADKKTKDSKKSTKEKEKKEVDSKKLISKSSEKLTINKKDTGRGSVKNGGGDGKTITKADLKNTIKNDSQPKKNTQLINNTKTEIEEKKELVENTVKNKKVNENAKSLVSNKSLDDGDTINDANFGLLGEKVSKNDEPQEIFNSQNPNQQFDFPSTVENQINLSVSSKDLEIEDSKETIERDFVENNTAVERESTISIDHKKSDSKDDNSSVNTLSDKDNINDLKNPGGDNSTNLKALASTVNDKKSISVHSDGVSHVETIPKSPEKTSNSENGRPKSVRPSSSRPGAPRLRDKHDNIISETENLIVGKVNIIAENTAIEEEEDSSMIIMEQEKQILQNQDEQEQFQLSSKPHGHLVQQILDSQKEFSQLAGKTEIEWEFGAQRAREAVNKEIEQLRYNIQGLSRVANPLGKILDHIQEDVEVMRQELQQWTKTFEVASKELLKQKSLNEDSLFPFRAKVKQLDVDINEKHEKINDLKILIHKNSNKIEKLLASGDVQY